MAYEYPGWSCGGTLEKLRKWFDSTLGKSIPKHMRGKLTKPFHIESEYGA